MNPNKQFGNLLSEGIVSVARRQGKTVAAVEQHIADAKEIGCSFHNVQRWRRGYVPKEPDQIAYLVRYCVKYGRVDRAWAQSILTQARYPEREKLLQELFPEQPRRDTVPRVYQNLPARYGEFLGRQADMVRVLDGLASRWPLVSIEGFGGVGKTTLAIEAARRCLPGPEAALNPPFEAVVWISAKDHPEQKRWLNEVLDTVARVLDYPYILQLPPEQKPAEVDRLLRIQRTLVIVDNFETIEDPDLVAWMQRIPEPSKLLITSRHAQLRTVWAIHLRGLEDRDALALIRRHAQRLGLKKVEEANDSELLPLVRVTDGNPKAIEMAMSHVKRGAGMDKVVDNLHNASKSVEDIFDYLFKWTWETLTEDARHVLLVMPFFADPVSKQALGATSGLRGYRFDTSLEQLVEMSLVDVNNGLEEARHRYSVHPLTRAFAEAKLREVPEWEKNARERWLDFYISFAEQYGVKDWDDPVPFQVLDREWVNIVGVAEWLYRAQELERLMHLLEKTWWLMHIHGYWDQRITLSNYALELALRQNNEERVCWLHSEIGWTLALQDRFEDAQHHFEHALEIAQRRNDPVLLDEVYATISLLAQRSRDIALFQTILPLWEKVIPVARKEPRERMRREVEVLYRKATVAYDRQNFEEATMLFEEMVRLSREAHWDRAVAYGLNYLGELAIRRGALGEGWRFLEEGWEIIQRWQDKRRIAYFEHSFALLEEAKGNLAQALEHAERSYDLFYRLGMSQEEKKTAQLLAHLGKRRSER